MFGSCSWFPAEGRIRLVTARLQHMKKGCNCLSQQGMDLGMVTWLPPFGPIHADANALAWSFQGGSDMLSDAGRMIESI